MIAAVLALIVAGGVMAWWCERDLARSRARTLAEMGEVIVELQKQNAAWAAIKEQLKNENR